LAVFAFFSRTKTDLRKFFYGLGENICSLPPAVKNTAPGPFEYQPYKNRGTKCPSQNYLWADSVRFELS